MTARGWRRLVWAGLAFTIGLYELQALIRNASLTDARLAAVGCIFKIAFQLTAMAFAWTNAERFERGNPSRPAWRFLALGCLALFLGQLFYAPYQLRLRRAPFPSWADLFFVISYPLLLLALAFFLRAYTHSGLVPVSSTQLGALAAATLVVAAALGYAVLKPLVHDRARGLEHLLNLAYPGFDLVLLVPTVLLVRFSLALRGGRLWPVWVSLLGGVLGLAAGDVAFSYLTSKGMSHLEGPLHVMFLAAYALLAQAALFQRQILRE
ncbi:MAG TPA: hypothetical protein VF310_12060 [Vicinamibacteria bacterium]